MNKFNNRVWNAVIVAFFIGLISSIYLAVKVVIWLFNHVNFL